MTTTNAIFHRLRTSRYRGALGLVLIAAVSFVPLILEPYPRSLLSAWHLAWLRWTSIAAVMGGMMVSFAVAAPWLLNGNRIGAGKLVFLGLVSVLLVVCHWWVVDSRSVQRPWSNFRDEYADRWQRENYLAVLNHNTEQQYIPHVFRPLPYGFIRCLEWLTGNWEFSRHAYRWYFTFWFLCAYHAFVSVYHGERLATWALLPYLVLYPFSVRYYLGQPADPMSHAFFALGFIYLVQNHLLLLAATLMVGVMAKETIIILIPAYLLCYWRADWSTLVRACILSIAGMAAFFAVRLPYGWSVEHRSINGAVEFMIASNLGLEGAMYKGYAPAYQNYLQPFLFVGVFLPAITISWSRADWRLRALAVVLTPLLLASNLCFGWMYESRNFVPLLPIFMSIIFSRRLGGNAARPPDPVNSSPATR